MKKKTKNTDKYGRTWNYMPGHNPDHMLQIPLNDMKTAYRFHLGFSGIDEKHAEKMLADVFDRKPVDCYLLKLGEEWHAGVRRSDEQGDYASPSFAPELIYLMIRKHKHACHVREWFALKMTDETGGLNAKEVAAVDKLTKGMK